MAAITAARQCFRGLRLTRPTRTWDNVSPERRGRPRDGVLWSRRRAGLRSVPPPPDGEAAVDTRACHWETAAAPSGGLRSLHSRTRHRPPPMILPDFPRAPCFCPSQPVLGRLTIQNYLQHSRLSATAAEIQHKTDYAETIATKNIRQTSLPSYLPCPVPASPPGRLKPKT